MSTEANNIAVLGVHPGGKLHANVSSYNLTTGAGGTISRILDTGADFMITPQTANRLGLKGTAQGTTEGTGEKRVEVSSVPLSPLETKDTTSRIPHPTPGPWVG